jgi:hypothetical protein
MGWRASRIDWRLFAPEARRAADLCKPVATPALGGARGSKKRLPIPFDLLESDCLRPQGKLGLPLDTGRLHSLPDAATRTDTVDQ